MSVYFWGLSTFMDESLEKALLDMESRDRALRAELTASGELDQQYHPRLESVHRANSARLRRIITVFGWPGSTLVGARAAQAAWRIALHAVSDPSFMRLCRDLLKTASERGDAPRWQFAMLDDRIRVYEGRPQRYGTQLRHGRHGPEPHPLDNQANVDSMRLQAGLPPLKETLEKARLQPQPDPATAATREASELAFRREVGWSS